jgi:hypothetical protein
MSRPSNKSECVFETNKETEDQSKENASHIIIENKQKKLKRKKRCDAKQKILFHCDYQNCNKSYPQKYRMEIHRRTHVFKFN